MALSRLTISHPARIRSLLGTKCMEQKNRPSRSRKSAHRMLPSLSPIEIAKPHIPTIACVFRKVAPWLESERYSHMIVLRSPLPWEDDNSQNPFQREEMLMQTKRVLLIAAGAVAAILLQVAPARLHAQPQAPASLSGQVTSAEEGPMEGVVVSAKRDGSTISISVVTNATGRFAFPAARLELGHYGLKARAAGYELDGTSSKAAADVASGQEAKAEIKL